MSKNLQFKENDRKNKVMSKLKKVEIYDKTMLKTNLNDAERLRSGGQY